MMARPSRPARQPHPPRLAAWLLRRLAAPDRRDEIEADLSELFLTRAASHGARVARRRYYIDVWSVLSHRWSRALAPPSSAPGLLSGLGRDVVFATRLFRRQPTQIALTLLGLAIAISVSTLGVYRSQRRTPSADWRG